MKILVTGGRDWTDERPIGSWLWTVSRWAREDHEAITLIHGGCRDKETGRLIGADAIADRIAREWGWKVEVFEADFAKYGDAAGPIRNRAMVAERPDAVGAFPTKSLKSKKPGGTWDCVDQALRAGLDVMVSAARRRA